MSHCETCKWLEPVGDLPRDGRDLIGACRLTHSGNNEARCKGSLAVAQDDEQWHAVLCVSRAFGCVQWEAK